MTLESDHLEELAELGQALRRLGWWRYVGPCRALYVALRDGGAADWNLEHARRLRAALGLGEGALPEGRACPCCPPPTPGTWAGARTVLHLPDRWVSACSRCQAEWVTREASSHVATPAEGAGPEGGPGGAVAVTAHAAPVTSPR